MKKIFTLAMLVCMGSSAVLAQSNSYKLEKNRVIYLTCDTVTSDNGEALPWSSSDVVNAFNAAGMALEGSNTADYGYAIALRNDYTDAETGFSLPKGYYRGLIVNGVTQTESATWSLYGNFVNPLTMDELNYSSGFKNLKKVVLYFVGIPGSRCLTNGINNNHQGFPTGRVQARYMSEDNTALTNQAYRETHAEQEMIYDEGATSTLPADHPMRATMEYQYKLKNFLGYEALADDAFKSGVNPTRMTFDRPFKLTVDLTNPKNGSDYEGIFQNAETKKNEFADLMADGLTEAEMSYYFAEVGDCPAYADNADSAPSATGYNVYAGRWGKKVNWTADTPIQVGIKGRLYLVGFALICATEGAETEYLDASAMEGFKADATAYGNNVASELPEDFATDPWKSQRKGNIPSGISTIEVENNTDSPIYNVAGQRVSKAVPGQLYIKDGKKYMEK